MILAQRGGVVQTDGESKNEMKVGGDCVNRIRLIDLLIGGGHETITIKV